jgi:hypothetical protein
LLQNSTTALGKPHHQEPSSDGHHEFGGSSVFKEQFDSIVSASQAIDEAQIATTSALSPDRLD